MNSIDDVMISMDQRTFQYQDELPSLPVPSLEHTLARYLDSVKPFLTNEEYKETEHLCWEFADVEGKILHDKLLNKAKHCKNWLEKWWENSYFETRLAAPLMNMFGPGPYLHDVWKPEVGTQIPRAALILFFTLQFWQLIRREQIRPQKDGKGRPLCMEQFHRLFNICRIPGVTRDHLVKCFQTETEGVCPSHVVVMCKGHIFSFQCLDDEGNLLTVPDLQTQLQKIADRASLLPAASGVGYFAALERTSWAQVRSHLLALHPENFHSLEKIQKSILVLGLDDDSPENIDDLSLKALFGDASNKWFDKALTFTAFNNGTFATNCDHSPIDGMMLVYCTYYAHCKILECKGQWKGTWKVQSMSEPEYLPFHLDNILHVRLSEAKVTYVELSQRVEVKAARFFDYAKGYLKSHNIHPDTHVQLALQLAYHRMYGKFAPTYETASTRQFYHARTETVRSCSPEACRWCQSMVDPQTKSADRLKLFKSAVAKHNQLMQEATALKGCDRHLFGLAMIAQEEGMRIPRIFVDPAFYKSGGGGNFILSSSCIGYTTVCGGVAPMCPHGYGVFYCIQEDRLTFLITSWTADQDTSATKFADQVQQALRDMKNLLEQNLVSPSRL